jgi:hypothetical protein
MPKPDEKIAEVGPFTIFRKSDAPSQYEIVGPAVDHSPLSYTMIRTTLQIVERIAGVVQEDVRKQENK